MDETPDADAGDGWSRGHGKRRHDETTQEAQHVPNSIDLIQRGIIKAANVLKKSRTTTLEIEQDDEILFEGRKEVWDDDDEASVHSDESI